MRVPGKGLLEAGETKGSNVPPLYFPEVACPRFSAFLSAFSLAFHAFSALSAFF